MASVGETRCATSDPTPMKLPNKEAKASAEAAEGGAEGERRPTPHASDTERKRVSQGLGGVRRTAQARKQERFTALLHHLDGRSTTGKLLRLKAECGPGSGRGKLAGV